MLVKKCLYHIYLQIMLINIENVNEIFFEVERLIHQIIFFIIMKKYVICGIVFGVSIFMAMNVKHNK